MGRQYAPGGTKEVTSKEHSMEISQGDLVELKIEKFADQGKSLARADGLVVFVEGAVPGDRVRAKIYKRKKSYAEAVVDELLEASDLRTAPRCFYFGTCGGCQWQHVQYQVQAEYKRQSVEEAFIHQGDFEDVEVRPTIKADSPYYYRNRMDFSFSSKRWLTPEERDSGKTFDMDFALGLHVPDDPDRVLDLRECHLQSNLSRRLVNGIRDFVKGRGWAAGSRNKKGYLQHLVIRQPEHTDDVMVSLGTRQYEQECMDALAAYLQDEFSDVTTFVNTIRDASSKGPLKPASHVLFGPGTVREKMSRFTFEIGPHDFFQTNTLQAERLYEVACAFAELQPDDVVYDLYCGIGPLSLFAAEEAGRVVGIEGSEETVERARANAARNEVDNCTFHAGRMRDRLTEAFLDEHGRPDVIIADPPRAGLHENVVRRLAEIQPNRFVYVSCNPQTQARDLRQLTDHYSIEAVQPVDLFPQTQHIENVVALRAI